MEGPLSRRLAHGRPLRNRVRERLTAHDRHALDLPDLRRAAVAITLVPADDGDAAFVLTRRSSGLRTHSRQYALPGGRIDAGESAPTAARRELHEEVNLAVAATEVLGLLDDYRTRSGFVITPVVVWSDDASAMAPQPDEVDHIMVIGLEELRRDDSPRWIDIAESPRRVLQLPLHDRLVHAPTAALLWQFREVALEGNLVRTTEVEEPMWAWR